MIDIEHNIKEFINGKGKNQGRNPDERYASFDYCYNYFQSFRENGKIDEIANEKNLQQSCLQLGFYLASWGMLRGSSFLLGKSARTYGDLLKNIVSFDKKVWDIDADSYSDEGIKILLYCKEMIYKSLGQNNKPSDTLITKIMLGIFGNVPAFDNYFNKGFSFYYCKRNQLKKLSQFYQDNKNVIDKYNKTIYTYDFLTGKETKRNYPKAKIIDMIGFVEGKNKVKKIR